MLNYHKEVIISCSDQSNLIQARLNFDKKFILGDLNLSYKKCIEIIEKIKVLLNLRDNTEYEWGGHRETFCTYSNKTIIRDNFFDEPELIIDTTEILNMVSDLNFFMETWTTEKLYTEIDLAFRKIKEDSGRFLINPQFRVFQVPSEKNEYFFTFSNLDVSIESIMFKQRNKVNDIYFSPFA